MDKLGLSGCLVKVCENLNIKTPTHIQTKAIPLVLQKKNLVAISPTATGKTATYCLPVLQLLSKDPFGIFCTIVLPTKELAIQVFQQFQLYASCFGFQHQILLIIGGDSWTSQSLALSKKPYIIVATPQRLLNYLEQDHILTNFKNLQFFIFDEADQLFDLSLKKTIYEILNTLPSNEICKLYFTATYNNNLKSYIESTYNCIQYYDNKMNVDNLSVDTIIHVEISSNFTANQIDQYYIFIPSYVKLTYLIYFLINIFKDKSGIVFIKTCKKAQLIWKILELYELSVTCLHSLLDHRRRTAHLAKFKNGSSRILIATDLVSRGLDIPSVDFVINLDFPESYETYVHRMGRTARRERSGICLSILSEKDQTDNVAEYEKIMCTTLKKFKLNDEEVLKHLNKVTKYKQEAKQILIESNFYENSSWN